MTESKKYDITIIGGGLAGLAASILLRDHGYRVALFEKEHYPFHKVCGEYISLESWGFLESIGLQLSTMQLPIIKQLVVSAPGGNCLQQALPFGGFGISRYLLDNELKKIAEGKGVAVYDGCKVDTVVYTNDELRLATQQGQFTSDICCGSFGKRSNLDIRLKRDFVSQKSNKLNNYIGVKYHVKAIQPADTIALHNFKDGYCGISKIEGDKYCLCYLTNAANLVNNNNSISEMERNVLYKNEHLKKIFTESEMLYSQPVTISQISFAKKTQVEDHILFLGDAAGMITPLCGNGMSMALHSSKIAVEFIHQFLQKKISRGEMEINYTKKWQQEFSGRLSIGRFIQSLFGKTWMTNLFVGAMKRLPAVTKKLIRSTHGDPF
ncbi:MAG: NAD(P)/FAD-dependent oxidoreductase [Ferruginibacter sp.]